MNVSYNGTVEQIPSKAVDGDRREGAPVEHNYRRHVKPRPNKVLERSLMFRTSMSGSDADNTGLRRIGALQENRTRWLLRIGLGE